MNEKLAPESNSINASNESIDTVHVTTSPREAALADGKAYAPGISVEEEGPEYPIVEGVKIADGIGPPYRQYAPPGADACEEPGVETTVGRGKICCEGGVGKYCCMGGAGKYCSIGGTGKNCYTGKVVYYIPDGTPVIMCALPRCPEDEFTTGSQINLLFEFFLHTTYLWSLPDLEH
jgi:hypothetical protein